MMGYKKLKNVLTCVVAVVFFVGMFFFNTTTFATDIYGFANLTESQSIDMSSVPSAAITSSYVLQQNEVRNYHGQWVTSGGIFYARWENYNCYAYAINRGEDLWFYPTTARYEPGTISGTGQVIKGQSSVDDIANLVIKDLEAMGYTNVSKSCSMPSINASQELICVRVTEDYEEVKDYDYHFMRYDFETNAWYHKPGYTAVLKFTGESLSESWIREYSANVEWEDEDAPLYNSDIIYIKYSKNQINVSTSATASKTIKENCDVFFEVNLPYTGTYRFLIVSAYSIEYEFYNEDFDILFDEDDQVETRNLAAGTYYLRVNKNPSSSSGNVSATISHVHSYTNHYVWYNNTQHQSFCACGDYILGSHFYNMSIPNFDDNCIYCYGYEIMGGNGNVASCA